MPPKKKQKRNISGLRNQQKDPTPPGNDCRGNSDHEEPTGIIFDSTRVDWENEGESDVESKLDLDDFEDEDFALKLADMAEKADVLDLDWLPLNLCRKKKGVQQ